MMKENMMWASEETMETGIRHSNEVLCALIQEGDAAAREELCVVNRKLVVKYASLFNRFYKSDLELEDLIQAGYLGLLTAADKFDLYQGTRFSTYCVYWIKQSIGRELMNSGMQVRLPVHVQEQIYRVTRIENRYAALSAEERVDAIALETGMSEKEVRRLLTIREQFKVVRSLNVAVSEEGEREVGELLADETMPTVEEIVEEKLRNEAISGMLMELKPREREVIIRRFGLDGNRAHRLEEIGGMLNVTRERVRQIEVKAIRKLRHMSMYSRVLEGYCA